MKDYDEKLFLASILTYRGLKKVQTLASIEQTKMRSGKHVSSNDLGGKNARRKKKREQPYGKAVSSVKFWSEVRGLKDNLSLHEVWDDQDIKDDAFKLFGKHTYDLELVKQFDKTEKTKETYFVLDSYERKRFAK